MPLTKLTPIRTLLVATAGLLAGLSCPSPALAAGPAFSAAPGQVVFSVDGGAVASNTFGGGASAVVALPTGGAVLAGGPACTVPALRPTACVQATGFYVAQLTASGALDPSFGVGGLAHIRSAPLVPVQLLRQADGRLIVVASGPRPSSAGPPPMLIVRLNPDGSLDTTFATGGVFDDPAGLASPKAALTPTGGIVVSGAVALPRASTATTPAGPSPEGDRWVVFDLTAAGALDPAFGPGGFITLGPTAGVIFTAGTDIAALPNGNIVVLGLDEPAGQGQLPLSYTILARLTPTGAPDPTFNAGLPVLLPAGAVGRQMLAYADGAVLVDAGSGLVRYTPAGRLDPSFGNQGIALDDPASQANPVQLLPAADGGALAIGPNDYARDELVAVKIAANGSLEPTAGSFGNYAVYSPALGGGSSSLPPSPHPQQLPPLLQASPTVLGQVAERPDGSLVVVGGVKIAQPTGPADSTGTAPGSSSFAFTAGALTPTFAQDTAFGAPPTPLTLKLAIATQRATTARARHGLRVKLTVATPGLAAVTIKASGRVIAQSVVPVFHAGASTTPVELTAYGDALLRRHPTARLSATASARDLLTRTARQSAAGRLR